jgi:hypothetical protein
MDVALLGVVANGIENHSLAVLGEALTSAGLRHRIVPFDGFAGMERMLGEVLSLRPRVCGVSLQTTEGLLAGLAFTRMLRERGYAGTIVVGGHVAALAGEHILAAATGVDVVVELGGEQALVGLARGEDPRSLPGTVTRTGRGRPPIAVRPRAIRRERLSEHLGFGAADLIASRGCEAHCGYCCIAAVSDLAVAGAIRAFRNVGQVPDEDRRGGQFQACVTRVVQSPEVADPHGAVAGSHEDRTMSTPHEHARPGCLSTPHGPSVRVPTTGSSARRAPTRPAPAVCDGWSIRSTADELPVFPRSPSPARAVGSASRTRCSSVRRSASRRSSPRSKGWRRFGTRRSISY